MTQTVLLGDIATIKGGKRLPKGEALQELKNTHPYLRIVDMGEKSIKKTNLQYVPDDVFPKISRYITNTKDVLLSIVGTIGLVAIVDEELDSASLTENCVKLTCDPAKIDPNFLYYFLTSSVGQDEIRAGRVGSTQPKLPLYNIAKIKIPNITLEAQKQIADTLGAIDEKIELNRRMNETLEQMGQALFRHYFIDNPEADDWGQTRVGEIAEVTDYVANGSFASLKANVTLYDEPKYALFVRTTDFKGGFNGSLKYTDKKSYKFLKKSTLFGGEFIISNVGDTGTVFRPPVWLGKPMTLGSNAIMIKDSEYNNYLYQYFRSNEGQFAISNIVAGSAQPKFNKTEFRNLKIKRPDAASLSEFNVQFRTIEDGVLSNIAQIQTLTTLRDTLLPRLISGKVKV